MNTTHPEIFDIGLPDGNRLIHIRAGLPIAFISAWLATGSRLDPPGKEGLAHFMEHLHMKTTPRFPSEAAMLAHNAAHAVRYNATTSPHRMWFHYTCADERAALATRDFVEAFSTAYIGEEMFRTEKTVIEDERKKREALPARQLLELSKRGLYPDTVLARNVLGTKESLDAVTYSDVDVFWKRHVVKAPKIFVVVSDDPHTELLSAFEMLPRLATEPTVLDPLSLPSPLPLVQQVGAVKNSEVSINYRTCPAVLESDALALDVLCRSYLTGRNSSRLGMRLRIEKQLTYGISAITEYGPQNGYASFRFSTAADRLPDALALCEEEFVRIQNGDIPEDALEAAKEDYAFGLLQRSMDPESLAVWHAQRALAGLSTQSIGAEVDAVRELTATDLQRVAREYLIEGRRSVAVLGAAR